MLNITTSSSYAGLDQALAACLAGRPTPLSPLAIIVPNTEMRRDLRLRITGDWGLSLLGVELHTAFGFARSILDEETAFTPDALLLELARSLLADETLAREWCAFANTSGGAGAVLSACLSLCESGAESRRFPVTSESPLYRIHDAFEEKRKALGWSIPVDITNRAARSAEESPWLKRFTKIVYAGFWDMTGAQAALLDAVSRVAEVTILVPSGDAPAFGFSRSFLDDVLRPLCSRQGGVEQTAETSATAFSPFAGRLFASDSTGLDATAEIVSVSGTKAELEEAARLAWQWVEQDGLAFHEIAIVARSLENYLPFVSSALDAWRMPHRCAKTPSRADDPELTGLLTLLRMLENGLRRDDVVEALACPLLNPSKVAPELSAYADLATRDFGVRGGLPGWRSWARRIGAYTTGDMVRVLPEKIALILAFVEAAEALRRALQQIGTWKDAADALTAFFTEWLSPDERRDEWLRALEPLDGLDGLGGSAGKRKPSLADIGRVVRQLWSGLKPPADPDAGGVEVLDMMAARGRRFRGIIIIGMNEGICPRMGREDVLLPDGERERLRKRVNVRLPRRQDAEQEERMLFALLTSAADEKLALLWQRSDDDGAPQVESWYLQEIRRLARVRERDVPRRLADRCREGLAAVSAADAEILSVIHQPTNAQPARQMEETVLHIETPLHVAPPSQTHMLRDRMLHAAREITALDDRLGTRDGMTGPLSWYPSPELWERGLSPTSLQGIARCPFQFFARTVLGLQALPEVEIELPPLAAGNLLHQALESFFQTPLTAEGWMERAEKAFADACRSLAARHDTGLPLLWQRQKDRLWKLVFDYLKQELDELSHGGWTVKSLEEDGQATLSFTSPVLEQAGAFDASLPDVRNAPAEIRFYGRLDRVDVRESTGEARIVDYKTKQSSEPSAQDKDLCKGAVTGQVLQPAVYLLLAKACLPQATLTDVSFHFFGLRWDNPFLKSEFPADCWQTTLGGQIEHAIRTLLRHLLQGHWCILPGNACRSCDFAPLCRKSHSPTRYRHAADSRVRELERLASAKLPKAGKAGDEDPATTERKSGKKPLKAAMEEEA